MLKKLIAFLGAKSFLADERGSVVLGANPRRPEVRMAREISRLGSEVAAADLDDFGSMSCAFYGTYPYWAPRNKSHQ